MNSKLDYLYSPEAIRERCQKIYELTTKEQGHFYIDESKWDFVLNFVLETIYEKYPDLNIPFHSRLGHFRPGGVDRLLWLEKEMKELSQEDRAKLLIDLVIPSVLLDAGAGAQWKYVEAKTQMSISRSEGLGVASYYMFLDKKFSSDQNLKTDAHGLMALTAKDLEKYFQVSIENPLVGVEGRLYLLQSLGKTLLENPQVFPNKRPSDLFEFFKNGESVDAIRVMKSLLVYLGDIWPARLKLEEKSLGDTWSHTKLGEKNSFESMVPFHKLTQWLSYSILDCCQYSGIKVMNVEKLTGLPEYRNGGLFLDLGLIQAKNKETLSNPLSPESEEIIEWRALTVVLLDELAQKVQKYLNKSPQEFPLAKVLEGGTWWAGRKIANQLRGGVPPLNIVSDGTVF